jgi:hypothetical protein
MNTEDNMKKIIEEVKSLVCREDLLHCLNKVLQSLLGLGSCRFVIPCFNKELVNDMTRKLRENGISSDIPMEEENILRATCCSHFNGCSECRAVCCLRDLLALPEGQNALLDEGLCEKVCRCVLHGAGIFDLSLLFALLRTSPDFGEDSLILFALENCINEAKRSETVEIAKMFFKATKELKLYFLTFESRFSADTRREKNNELRKMELELCGTVYADKIAQIQEEEAAAAAALLEVKKSGMDTCSFCLGDPIKNRPIFGPKTCRHKICCEECVHTEDLNEKLKYRCPLCRMSFTDADVWWCLGDPVVSDTD